MRPRCSVTSGSPNSQEGNLDTEAGPDIGELDNFNEDEFRWVIILFSMPKFKTRVLKYFEEENNCTKGFDKLQLKTMMKLEVDALQ